MKVQGFVISGAHRFFWGRNPLANVEIDICNANSHLLGRYGVRCSLSHSYAGLKSENWIVSRFYGYISSGSSRLQVFKLVDVQRQELFEPPINHAAGTLAKTRNPHVKTPRLHQAELGSRRLGDGWEMRHHQSRSVSDRVARQMGNY